MTIRIPDPTTFPARMRHLIELRKLLANPAPGPRKAWDEREKKSKAKRIELKTPIGETDMYEWKRGAK